MLYLFFKWLHFVAVISWMAGILYLFRLYVNHAEKGQSPEVHEVLIQREMPYTADEIFLTGTASEVTPVRSVDKIAVGTGKAGEITMKLQRIFLDLVHGKGTDAHGWLTHVRAERASAK